MSRLPRHLANVVAEGTAAPANVRIAEYVHCAGSSRARSRTVLCRVTVR
jgi:hypothetical protein